MIGNRKQELGCSKQRHCEEAFRPTKQSMMAVGLLIIGMLSGCYAPDPTTSMPDHRVSLIANPEKGGKLVAVPKPCPNWENKFSDGLDNNFKPQFGCADMYNLGKMIAEPADLMRGRTLGNGDAASGVLGIERYRSDKQKELINPKDIGATTK
jgi:Pilus biogenesis CpaD protein (pilus_cpaD)